MRVGLFKPLKGPAHFRRNPMATPREMLDRLKGDVDNLVVGVLDDLTFEVIRAYQNHPPPGYLEWVSTTATHRIRRLAQTVAHDRSRTRSTAAASGFHRQPEAMRYLVVNWLEPQMEQSFGPLPEAVKKVLSVKAG